MRVNYVDEVTNWLDDFAGAVATQDFARGSALFDPHVVAYGTRSGAMTSLDELRREQWGPIWTQTRGFRFDQVDAVLGVAGHFVVAARWESRSASGRHRHGRCTLVLAGSPLQCLHSHFSMTPEDGGQVDGVVGAPPDPA